MSQRSLTVMRSPCCFLNAQRLEVSSSKQIISSQLNPAILQGTRIEAWIASDPLSDQAPGPRCLFLP